MQVIPLADSDMFSPLTPRLVLCPTSHRDDPSPEKINSISHRRGIVTGCTVDQLAR